MLRISAFFLIVLFFSCQSDQPPDKLDIMHEEVMMIHDEVMPKMRNINQAKKALRKIDGYEDDFYIKSTIEQLDSADEGMMEWMAQFDKPNKKDSSRAISYYEDQMVKISKVRDDMLTSIAKADSLVQARNN